MHRRCRARSSCASSRSSRDRGAPSTSISRASAAPCSRPTCWRRGPTNGRRPSRCSTATGRPSPRSVSTAGVSCSAPIAACPFVMRRSSQAAGTGSPWSSSPALSRARSRRHRAGRRDETCWSPTHRPRRRSRRPGTARSGASCSAAPPPATTSTDASAASGSTPTARCAGGTSPSGLDTRRIAEVTGRRARRRAASAPGPGRHGLATGTARCSVDRRPRPLRRRPLPQRRPLRRRLGTDRVDRRCRPTCRAASTPSGCGAEHGEDRVPFFVRPAAARRRGRRRAAHAVVHLHRLRQPPQDHRRHRLHPGPHPPASGARVRARPIPRSACRTTSSTPTAAASCTAPGAGRCSTCGPGADGWTFTADTDLDAFLAHTGGGHDVITDEDVHAEGVAALAPYRVVVTGSHPEYWSTAMLDALAGWQRGGGRLMYLGGNGFYWRVAFSEHWPGVMEVRRAEDGVRNWLTEPGRVLPRVGRRVRRAVAAPRPAARTSSSASASPPRASTGRRTTASPTSLAGRGRRGSSTASTAS